jgi:hypothetical protein
MAEEPQQLLSGRQASKGVPASFHFHVRRDAMRRIIEKTVTWWAKNYPQELRRYKKEVRALREGSHNSNGMSIEGSLMLSSLIPTRINVMLGRLVPGFWNAGGRELWFELFEDFRVRKENTKFK